MYTQMQQRGMLAGQNVFYGLFGGTLIEPFKQKAILRPEWLKHKKKHCKNAAVWQTSESAFLGMPFDILNVEYEHKRHQEKVLDQTN